MDEMHFFKLLLAGWFGLSLLIFGLLLFINAPYGRHFSTRWGKPVKNTYGWIIMEATSAIAFTVFFLAGNNFNLTVLFFFVMWQAHYLHRAFIYPLTIHSPGRMIPLVIVAAGILFNLVNAYLNGRYIFTFSTKYNIAWLSDPRFIGGALLFLAGFAINRRADRFLTSLRSNGETGYYAPQGGLFEWVSCPNYLGEIIIWTGWAVATWSLAGLSFAVWTFANLAPRARAHHIWYRDHIDGYPGKRRALIPFLW